MKGQREDLFWNKINKSGMHDCWPWLASTNKDGYGQFWIGHTFIGSHRYAWELTRKCSVPSGMYILHTCDNPVCCNPHHLYCGTQSDNMSDRSNRGPKTPAHILGNPSLYRGEVWLIREILFSRKIPQWKIAKIFKVHQSTISHINTSSSWLCKEGYYV